MNEATSTPAVLESIEHTPQWTLGNRNYRLLSELTGASPHYLSRILRGRSKPSVPLLIKIAFAAHIQVWTLYEYLEGQREKYAAAKKPNGQRRLSDDDAIAIRQRYANRAHFPVTVRSLAADYNVSRQTISLIIRHIIYKLPIAA